MESASGSGSNKDVVKVKREKLVACMSCSLCHELFIDPTTIQECFHTFCRKCITDKIRADNLRNCPVCKTDMGPHPLRKLRDDKNLKELRLKLFPLEVNQHKKDPSLQARNNDVSDVSPPIPSALSKKWRGLSAVQSSAEEVTTKGLSDAKPPKQTLSSSASRLPVKGVGRLEAQVASALHVEVETRKMMIELEKAPADGLNVAQCRPALDLPALWIKLIALPPPGSIYACLPQISTPYLKIKNGRMTVSRVKKYLGVKLGVQEAEVVIIFRGNPIHHPALELHRVMESWLHSLPSEEKFAASIGSSAGDFVMELNYALRRQFIIIPVILNYAPNIC